MQQIIKPERSQPWYRSALLPLGFVGTIKMISPALVIGAIAGIIMRDFTVVVLACAFGLTCVASVGRLFAEYKIVIPDRSFLERAIKLLDETKELKRHGVEMKWDRIYHWKLLSTNSDHIEITNENAHWIARGGRLYIASLAVALNKRAADGNL